MAIGIETLSIRAKILRRQVGSREKRKRDLSNSYDVGRSSMSSDRDEKL